MNTTKSQNIKLGIFVLLAVTVFVIGIYSIGNQKNLFGSNIKISSLFTDVKGLQEGNNIRYSGINVGVVDDIIVLNDTLIQVDFLVEKKIQPFIKKDAISSIGTDGLVGNVVVNIEPGKGKSSPVKEGDIIPSIETLKTDHLLGSLDTSMNNINRLTEQLILLVESLRTGEGSISSLINDKTIAQHFETTASNLSQSSEKIKVMSEILNTQISLRLDDVQNGKGAMGYLLSDNSLKKEVNQLADNLDTLVERQIVPILNNLHNSSSEIQETTTELNKLINGVKLDQGIAGVLLNDSLSELELKQTLTNLNAGTQKFNESMEALKHNFLLKGYFKRKARKTKRGQYNNGVVESVENL